MTIHGEAEHLAQKWSPGTSGYHQRSLIRDAYRECARGPSVQALVDALKVFDNRRKLAYSLRNESPHLYAFFEATGCEMDKYCTLQAWARTPR